MALMDDINNQIKEAMKAKDQLRLDTLRSLKSAVKYKEVEGGQSRTLDDGEVLQVIAKEAKKRKDSVEAFRGGGREEQAQKEEAELKIIETFLPQMLGEAEIEELVKKAIADSGATSKKQMGDVMKRLMPDVRGRADGKLVNQIVGRLLE